MLESDAVAAGFGDVVFGGGFVFVHPLVGGGGEELAPGSLMGRRNCGSWGRGRGTNLLDGEGCEIDHSDGWL